MTIIIDHSYQWSVKTLYFLPMICSGSYGLENAIATLCLNNLFLSLLEMHIAKNDKISRGHTFIRMIYLRWPQKLFKNGRHSFQEEIS